MDESHSSVLLPRKNKKDRFFYFSCLLLTFFLLLQNAGCKPEWNVLSSKERQVLGRIQNHSEIWIPEKKKDGTAPLIHFEDLYRGLGPEESRFLDRVRALRPKDRIYVGEADTKILFKRIENQWIEKKGVRSPVDPQYLPQPVFEACEKMMMAMKEGLGKRLFVESGYRSPAYQLYTFLYFLPKHGYSIQETRRWVALPGYSEHGDPAHQAIDFVNQDGVNGDDRAEDFEILPEYHWLLAHAREFDFKLSYPRGTPGTTFEPWHWRYTASES